VNSKDSRISTLESDVETIKREKVSALYAAALVDFESGEQNFSNAQTSESNGDHDIALGVFAIANGHYTSAQGTMDRAASVADEVGATDARDTIQEASAAVPEYASASVNYANENLFRSRGSTPTADDYESRGDDALNSARSKTVASLSTVDSQLGL
jgi:subtilisin family serine protease